MVDFSKQQNRCFIAEGKIMLVQASVDALCFQGGFFDLVTAVETFYFWPNLHRAFHEIHRVLKPDGRLLIVSEMIKDGIYEAEHKEIIAKTRVKLYPFSQLQAQLEDEGFSVNFIRKPGSAWNVIVAQKI